MPGAARKRVVRIQGKHTFVALSCRPETLELRERIATRVVSLQIIRPQRNGTVQALHGSLHLPEFTQRLAQVAVGNRVARAQGNRGAHQVNCPAVVFSLCGQHPGQMQRIDMTRLHCQYLFVG